MPLHWFCIAVILGAAPVRALADTPTSSQTTPSATVCASEEVPQLRPDLKLVLTRTYNEPVSILPPRDEAGAGGPALIFTGRRLEAWEPASGAVLWSIGLRTETQPELLAACSDRLIVSSAFTVVSLDPLTGRPQWHVGQEPDPVVTARRDPEFLPRMTLHALTPTRLLAISNDHQAFMLRVSNGSQVWQQKLRRHPAGPLAVSERFVAYAAVDEGRSAIVVLDAREGRELRTITREDGGQISFLQFSADDSIIAGGTDWLATYDAVTGDTRWSLPVPAGLRTSELQLAGDKLLAILGDGQVAAWRVHDGHRIGAQDLGELHAAHFVGRPAVAENKAKATGVIVGTARSLMKLNIASGRPKWRYQAPAGTTLGPACLTRDFILVQTQPDPMPATSPSPTSAATRAMPQLCFISRVTGRLVGAPLDLTTPSERPISALDWVVYDGALLIRQGQSISCWSRTTATKPS